MNIKYDWSTLSVWEMLAAFIPFHAKRYLNKLDDISDYKIAIAIDHADDLIKAKVYLSTKDSQVLMQRQCCLLYGISIMDLWDKILDQLANYENMKNAEELCVWIDMKVHA